LRKHSSNDASSNLIENEFTLPEVVVVSLLLGPFVVIPSVDGLMGNQEKASTITLSGPLMYLKVGEYSSKTLCQQQMRCKFKL
jgi:hypothetical protein